MWTFPTTSVGLLFVPAALVGGRMQWVDGVLELSGGGVAYFLEHCIRPPTSAAGTNSSPTEVVGNAQT